GQVVLALRVVRGQPLEMVEQRSELESVDAAVDFRDGALVRRRVALFDDAGEAALRVADDASVSMRIRERGGQHGRGSAGSPVRVNEASQRLGLKERDVGIQQE